MAAIQPSPSSNDLQPPYTRTTPLSWALQNLFNNWHNTVFTLFFGVILSYAAYRGLRFFFVTARWEIVETNLTNLMVGQFPRNELERVWAALFLLGGSGGFIAGQAKQLSTQDPTSPPPSPGREQILDFVRRAWPFTILVLFLLRLSRSTTIMLLILALVALTGAGRLIGARIPGASPKRITIFALATACATLLLLLFNGPPSQEWGGLLLTVFLSTVSILASFPLGILLALGRRSSLPAIRFVCVGYIEVIRGVPLITLLLLSTILKLFLPPNSFDPNDITRAAVVLALFTAAYVAEIMRGGFQAIPQGQIEAAQALGLVPIQTIRLIGLPQAIRKVVPALVGQFISLLKDTSLVSIIGLSDILKVSRSFTSQDDFVGKGLTAETLAAACLVYWALCFTMSKESKRLEERLGVGER